VFVCVCVKSVCVWVLLLGFLFAEMGMGSFLTSFCECVVFLCLEVECVFLCFWLFFVGLVCSCFVFCTFLFFVGFDCAM